MVGPMTSIPSVPRRVLTWLLSAAAFVAVVTAAGCEICPNLHSGDARDHGRTNAPRGKALVRDPFPDAPVVRQPGPGADVVNVFGEFGNARQRRGPVRQTGEAGFQQHTRLDEGEDSAVAVDPTGHWMAFASTRHSEKSDVYLQRVDGTAVTQLTSDPADDAFPAFSPDGRSIAFASTRSGPWQIYTMDLDGRNVVQVTTGRMQCVHPSFSPDGRRLVYCGVGSRSGQWELWTADLENGAQRMIGYGLFPRWSPRKDLDRIAYQRARQRGTRWFSLWTMDIVDGEGRRPTEIAVSPSAAIVTPSWSPDGKRLAFTTVVEPSRGVAGTPVGRQDVWTVDADGSNRQRVTDGSGSNLMPFWGADGRVYFISDRDGHESIWSARAEGGPKTVTAETDERDAH